MSMGHKKRRTSSGSVVTAGNGSGGSRPASLGVEWVAEKDCWRAHLFSGPGTVESSIKMHLGARCMFGPGRMCTRTRHRKTGRGWIVPAYLCAVPNRPWHDTWHRQLCLHGQTNGAWSALVSHPVCMASCVPPQATSQAKRQRHGRTTEQPCCSRALTQPQTSRSLTITQVSS